MSEIESAALPTVEALVDGGPHLIGWEPMHRLATLLCLVLARTRLAYPGVPDLPQTEIESLRYSRRPTDNWRVWIAYFGDEFAAFQSRYCPLQLCTSADEAFGVEHVNTEILSASVGRLFVHVFYSSVWPDFPGRPELCRIWPPSYYDVDTRLIPGIDGKNATLLYEAVAREYRLA